MTQSLTVAKYPWLTNANDSISHVSQNLTKQCGSVDISAVWVVVLILCSYGIRKIQKEVYSL